MGQRRKSNEYRLPEWKTFRGEMLERDGHRCCRCGRSSVVDGVVLQVHHKLYIPARKPWEYKYEECELLCRGCHGAEHGLVRPSVGWECIGDDDLGDLCGNCELCGTELRYIFFVSHPHWEPMEVGTICCDNLTGTEIASNKMESINRYNARLARFMTSVRWALDNGVPTIRQKGIDVSIVLVDSTVRLCLDGVEGKVVHSTVEDAKRAVFEFIESGKADEWVARRKNNDKPPTS